MTQPGGHEPAFAVRTLSTSQRVVIVVICVLAGLGVLCGGGALLAVSVGTKSLKAAGKAAKSEKRRSRADIAAARAQLEGIADGIRASGAIPEALPEAPPDDPWGRPVRYLAIDDRSARLESAGPDGDFATTDDNVAVDVRLR